MQISCHCQLISGVSMRPVIPGLDWYPRPIGGLGAGVLLSRWTSIYQHRFTKGPLGASVFPGPEQNIPVGGPYTTGRSVVDRSRSPLRFTTTATLHDLLPLLLTTMTSGAQQIRTNLCSFQNIFQRTRRPQTFLLLGVQVSCQSDKITYIVIVSIWQKL